MEYRVRLCQKMLQRSMGLFLLFFCLLFIAQFAQAGYLDNWTTQTSMTTNDLTGIAYGKGTFVAVGDLGTILTSPDGANWTPQSSLTTKMLNGVAFGNNTFVAIADLDTILTSPDGTSWTPQSSPYPSWTFGNQILLGITYGNGFFVATGGDGTITTSPDGATWTPRTHDSRQTYSAVAFGNDTFVAVGFSSGVLTSPDGETWSLHTNDLHQDFNAITYGNSGFVAVGFRGGICSTPDGINWAKRTSDTTEILSGATYDNNTFVAVGDNGVILSSRSGETWTVRSSGITENLHDIVFGNGTFVAVGSSGTILQSEAVLPLNLVVDEGTIGTQIIIEGSGFGDKKGKVLVGGATAKIATDGWSDSQITATVKKVLAAGPYQVTIVPKGTDPITLTDTFTMTTPVTTTLSPDHAVVGTEVTVEGKFFSIKKGKVYLEDSNGIQNKCKVMEWFMDPPTGASRLRFIVPTKLTSGSYTLGITNKVGAITTAFSVD